MSGLSYPWHTGFKFLAEDDSQVKKKEKDKKVAKLHNLGKNSVENS